MTSSRPGTGSGLDLAESFAAIARLLLREGNVTQLLERVTLVAVETIEGCDSADISLVEGDTITPVAATDDVARACSELQSAVDEGPCLSAIKDHQTFRIDNMATEPRWPKFAHRAAEEHGTLSMLGFRLFAEEDTFGALNLYSQKAFAFDANAEATGAVFAAHAAVAFVAARHEEQFRRALQSRDVIGQAKGIIMSTRHVSDEEAFAILRRTSEHLNVKLRTIAAEVAATLVPPE